MPPDISVPEIMALIPTTEPMDRSMPPMISTSVWPSAATPKKDICLKMTPTLYAVRKFGVAKERIAPNRAIKRSRNKIVDAFCPKENFFFPIKFSISISPIPWIQTMRCSGSPPA